MLLSMSVGEFIALFAFASATIGSVVTCTSIIVTNKIRVNTVRDALVEFKKEHRAEADNMWAQIHNKVDKVR